MIDQSVREGGIGPMMMMISVRLCSIHDMAGYARILYHYRATLTHAIVTGMDNDG